MGTVKSGLSEQLGVESSLIEVKFEIKIDNSDSSHIVSRKKIYDDEKPLKELVFSNYQSPICFFRVLADGFFEIKLESPEKEIHKLKVWCLMKIEELQEEIEDQFGIRQKD